MAGSDITLVAGLEGGGSLSGESGKRINKQLQKIILAINKSHPLKVKAEIDHDSITDMERTLRQFTDRAKKQADELREAYTAAFKAAGNVADAESKNSGVGGASEQNINDYLKAYRKTLRLMNSINSAKKKWSDADSDDHAGKSLFDQYNSYLADLLEWREKLKTAIKSGEFGQIDLGEFTIDYEDASQGLKTVNKELSDLEKNAKSMQTLAEGSDKYRKCIKSFDSELNNAEKAKKKYSAAGDHEESAWWYADIENQITALKDLRNQMNELTEAQFKQRLGFIQDDLARDYKKIAESGFDMSKADELKKFTSQLTELDNAIEKSEQNLKAWSAASSGMASGDYEGLQKQIRLLDELRDKLLSAGHALNNFDEQMADINKSNALHGSNIKKRNKDYKTFGDNIIGIFEEVGQYVDAMDIIFEGIQYGRQMVEAVTDIDTAMTELRKVTDETEATYASFMDKAVTRATELGASVADVVSASADFARLGHDLGDSSTLADAALVYKNVGDGISDIDTASSSIISTMQAFGIEAKNAMSIVDSFNAIGNNFAISSAGVGDALLNSAASLAAAGNDIHEAVALIAAANTTIQDPGRVGKMLAQRHGNMSIVSRYMRQNHIGVTRRRKQFW